ncbi:MAG TPA: D-glycero-beta-D-manno-heptose-7-phosphate kinase [Pyrinomonadaceae bacterium]
MDISGFKKARVLVIGDVMLDRYWWGSVTRISPEAPVPIVQLERETTKPGGAANVAANAAALGATVGLIGLVGTDPDSAILRDALNDAGVAFLDLLSSVERRTTIKTRIVAHGQQVVRLDAESTKHIDGSEADGLISTVKRHIGDVRFVILSDYGKGTLTARIVSEIVGICRSAGVQVLADPKGKHFEKYSGATVLTPNRREAAEACKIEESDPRLVWKAGKQLLSEHDLENVLITESENGMTLFRRSLEPKHFDASAHEVFDVTGAGDTVIAGLGVALAAGLPIEDAVHISNVAAGLSVQHIGTVAITFDDLNHALRSFSTEEAEPAVA